MGYAAKVLCLGCLRAHNAKRRHRCRTPEAAGWIDSEPSTDKLSIDEMRRKREEYCREHGISIGRAHSPVWSGMIERNANILALHEQGLSLSYIAGLWNVSKERVRKIIMRQIAVRQG